MWEENAAFERVVCNRSVQRASGVGYGQPSNALLARSSTVPGFHVVNTISCGVQGETVMLEKVA